MLDRDLFQPKYLSRTKQLKQTRAVHEEQTEMRTIPPDNTTPNDINNTDTKSRPQPLASSTPNRQPQLPIRRLPPRRGVASTGHRPSNLPQMEGFIDEDELIHNQYRYFNHVNSTIPEPLRDENKLQDPNLRNESKL